MLALGAMVTVNLIYGHLIPRRLVLIFWACFLASHVVLFRLLDLPIPAIAVQTLVIFAFLLRGAKADVARWME